MKRIIIVLLGLFFIVNVNAAWDYETKRNHTGDFEQTTSWKDEHAPSSDGDIDRKMTINGNITRNGDLIPVNVTVRGTFIVTGNYLNEQWGGLTVENGAKVEIFGDLTGSAGISVKKDGLLIVHGNLSSTGSRFKANGDVIVKGDFSTSSSTHIQNKGNLVVGGDFSHLGGGLKAKSDDIYILNPDATIVSPGWGIINDGDYGDVDDFLKKEDGTDLAKIVEEEGLLNPAIEWVGTKNSEWSDLANWKASRIPDANSSVKIEASDYAPEISGDVILANLRIEEGSELILKPGASLEVTEDITNDGLVVVESESNNLSSFMLPNSGTQSGKVNVNLELEADGKWYLSSPLKEEVSGKPKVEWFYPDNDAENDFVYVLRDINGNGRGKWVRVDKNGIDGDFYLKAMESVAANYKKQKTLDYTGKVYQKEVSRTVSGNSGFTLIGNPFLSTIDWGKTGGWERRGFSETMYSLVTVEKDGKEKRVLQTVNSNGIYTIKSNGYDDSDITHIPPYQSVWVKKEVEGDADITIKPQARVRNNDVPLKSSSADGEDSYDLIRINSKKDGSLDGTVLYFSDDFSAENGSEDSEKMFNGSKNVPEIYTRIGSEAISINGQTSLDKDKYEFPLSVRNRVEGDVTLSVDLVQFDVGYEVVLEDKDKGTYVNLGGGSEYTYTPREIGKEHDRFVLHLEKTQQVPTWIEDTEKQNVAGITISGRNEYVVVNIDNNLLQQDDATIELLDINGRLIRKLETRNNEERVKLPESFGTYLIRVQAADKIETGKVMGP